jgi:hypothetical protein
MSFVGPPFEHDVFFSYAHADVDGVGDAEIKTWCQKFANDLRQALRRFPEFAPLSLYLDESPREGERLDETSELTPSLRAAAGASALFCAMISPWYLKSDWCAKERQWWDEGTRALAPTIASGFDRAFICRLMEGLLAVRPCQAETRARTVGLDFQRGGQGRLQTVRGRGVRADRQSSRGNQEAPRRGP